MVGSMSRQTRERRLRVEADGVRIHELPGVRPGVWLAALAVIVSAVALLLFARQARHADPSDPAALQPRARLASDAAPAQRAPAQVVAPPAAPPVVPRRPAPAAPAAPPAAAAVGAGDGEPPPHDDAVFGQPQSGEPSGMALFPPPGTKPIKRGLLVPEDFELPPGYVRHYQATDDGERVPAILMFHPDYHPVDEHGDPIALPADRVVPPEMAPPGMPIEMLELPEDQESQTADGQ